MSQPSLQSVMPSPDPLPDAFRAAFRRHPAGVALITADHGGQPVALTLSSLISVSAAPPVVAFTLSSKSTASQAVLAAGAIVIHLLQFDHVDLAVLGATSGADRFGPGVEWERLPSGEPRYSRVGTWFRARIAGTLAVDGATIVAAELIEGQAEGDGPGAETLVYCNRRWHRLGDAHDAASR